MKPIVTLIYKVISFKVPTRLLSYAVQNKFHRWLKTGNRRFEFERYYLENPNPYSYRTSPYEQGKYERTIETALKFRSGSECALEVGCSIGVFTKMLANQFQRVTANDISQEAIEQAATFNCKNHNIRFVRSDLRSLNLGTRYNVIFCAEVLYSIREKDASVVCKKLDQHLDTEGIIITVGPQRRSKQDFFNFEGWDEIFASHFKQVSKTVVEDSTRPYEITVFCRRPSTRAHNVQG